MRPNRSDESRERLKLRIPRVGDAIGTMIRAQRLWEADHPGALSETERRLAPVSASLR